MSSAPMDLTPELVWPSFEDVLETKTWKVVD